MQGWFGLRQHEDQSAQHLKQDTRSHIEDVQRLARSPRHQIDEARLKEIKKQREASLQSGTKKVRCYAVEKEVLYTEDRQSQKTL